MNSLPPREILEAGITAATLMQVATLDRAGCPVMCHVWFRAGFRPDRLHFISRPDRNHSINIRNDSRVAAGIALAVPSGLGEPVRGVTLTGHAHQVPEELFRPAADDFVARWPDAAGALRPATADPLSAPSQIYQIDVTDWVLFDEVNFPGQPRISLPGR